MTPAEVLSTAGHRHLSTARHGRSFDRSNDSGTALITCTAIWAVAVVLIAVVVITGSADSVGTVTPWLLALLGVLTAGQGARRILS